MNIIKKNNNLDRIHFFVGLTFLCFVFLLLQLYRWQIVDYNKFSTLAREQTSSERQLDAKRGNIYSSDGVILASDRPVWDVYLSISSHKSEREGFLKKKKESFKLLNQLLQTNIKPSSITNLDYQILVEGISDQNKKMLISAQLNELNKIDEENIIIRQRNQTITNKKDDLQPLKKVEDANLFGIHFTKKQQRFYPNGRLASQVIGFVGTTNNGEDIGSYGIEGYFWGDMKGVKGQVSQEQSLTGKTIVSQKYQAITAREGRNIELTINIGLQRKVEKMLKIGVINNRAKSGTVIIMNPRNGQILAMANYPDYNPNYYWQEKNIAVYRNKAVADVYEFGSVGKAITIATALNDGKITPETICRNNEKFLLIQEKKIFNYNFIVWGDLQPKDVLRHSVNLCAARFGLMVGKKSMHNYLTKLGFGNKSNIGLQDEETSLLKPPDEWLKIDLATISFGQTISATPLQLISAMSTLANNGIRMQPQLVKRIFNSYNQNDEVIITPEPKGRTFSKKTTDQVSGMLSYAISKQYQFARFHGRYNIAGKTGTAQIPKLDGPGYYENKINGTFVGYAPANDPTIIMLVRLEDPKKGSIAGQTTVPLWVDIFDAVKEQLGIKQM